MEQKLLSGRYVLREVIGMGGMSIVYRAWDSKQDREVAVKVLRPEFSADAEFVRRFNQEAQAASRMSHPNIVGMYDLGQDGDLRYIVMEYIRGSTLKDIIRAEAPMNAQKAVQITLRILAAVHHAHNNHIVHRDIKPQNILVQEDGSIKVADFGIARLTTNATLTTSFGNMLGSVHYFSPEQASGQLADEKSDLYSVGVVFYEMITGKVPFEGESPVAVALKHVSEPPEDPRELNPQVSRALAEVSLKALAKSPDERYQSATDMATDLKKALKNPQGGFVTKESGEKRDIEREKRHKRRMKQLRAVSLLLLAAVFVIGVRYAAVEVRRLVNRVTVPSLALMNLEDAEARLEEMGLQYEVDEKHHAEVAAGVVYEQYPEFGTKLQKGDVVRLTVSLGKDRIMMPKLLEMTRADAQNRIESEGLVLSGVTLQVSDARPDTVIGQQPAANELVDAGTEVTLVVSGESSPMPDLTGMTRREAEEMLTQRGFSLGNVAQRATPEADPDTVIDQSVPPETLTLLGESVNLVVAEYQPDVYHAEVTFSVPVANNGDEVRCALVGSDGAETEVYVRAYKAGTQSITLSLDGPEPGEFKLNVYVAGELALEKMVAFE